MSTRDQIYAFIRDFIDGHGYSPSYREIGDGVGLRSPSTVVHHLGKLAEEGRIGYVRDSPRTLHLKPPETGEEVEHSHR